VSVAATAIAVSFAGVRNNGVTVSLIDILKLASVSPLLLVIVVLNVLNTFLVVVLCGRLALRFLLGLLLLRGRLVLGEVLEVQRRHEGRLFAKGALVGPAVDRLEAVVGVEREHEAALVVRLHLLVLGHDVGKTAGRDVLNALFLVQLVHRDALVLQGEQEEQELVLFVFMVLDLLLHLRQPPSKRLHLN